MLDIIHSLIACSASVILWRKAEGDYQYQQAWHNQSAGAVDITCQLSLKIQLEDMLALAQLRSPTVADMPAHLAITYLIGNDYRATVIHSSQTFS
ncbi:hypothetical protein [Nostoc sp. WHI]|uniref:hypothetical protein n=1 Tax=Nostoc sp. WHI TaxID=2650611 RepID=UPI0018C6EED1|nr:hypothetical protein [Nostoc sp. WHI]MBG1266075.1 hypothetical protein [Nostoc sp. WHI]